jgi:hypothetical protein
MSAGDGDKAPSAVLPTIQPVPSQRGTEDARRNPGRYGTIVIVGGGCYGAYYLRQLRRARDAAAVSWTQLIVVDRDPDCRVAQEGAGDAIVRVAEWRDFFADFLDGAARDPARAAAAAIVPSPLMPHLLFDWIIGRARARWPGRTITVVPLERPPDVPWQRASQDGATHYVSFAEWMCPINCIEPVRCPKTRDLRGWTMPGAVRNHVDAERSRGHVLNGPFVFHCTHRAYGVGMIDVQAVLEADRDIAALGQAGSIDALVGTMSHCHGALGRFTVR